MNSICFELSPKECRTSVRIAAHITERVNFLIVFFFIENNEQTQSHKTPISPIYRNQSNRSWVKNQNPKLPKSNGTDTNTIEHRDDEDYLKPYPSSLCFILPVVQILLHRPNWTTYPIRRRRQALPEVIGVAEHRRLGVTDVKSV